jgi:hypothetical protein
MSQTNDDINNIITNNNINNNNIININDNNINNNLINNINKTENENENENIIINTIYTHKININFPENATLYDLKTQISKNFLIREDEYELFIGENSLSKINNKKLLNEIISQCQNKEFKIKSYKSIFDLKKQLLDYNEYLDKSIKEKQKEIEDFKQDYKELINVISSNNTNNNNINNINNNQKI